MVIVKVPRIPEQKAIREMQLSQIGVVDASFDEPNLIGSAGLVPVMRLARRAGLASLVAGRLTVPGGAGVDAGAKVASVVAGMITGADSIDDLDVLREGAVGKVLPGVKAPSTLGTFLRAFTFGHVRQLDAVAGGLLAALAAALPELTGQPEHRDAVSWLDIDDTMRQTHGYAKQGVGYGYNKVKGLNALLGIVSCPAAAPVIVGHRLRKGAVSSARGAAKFVCDAVAAARRAGAGTVICCRADSAYYNHAVTGAVLAAEARFSITARMDKAVQKAIAGIDEDAWVPIHYPNAIYDEDEQRWISDAEVAETGYTAFRSKGRTHRVAAQLIVRRVKRLNPSSVPQGQGELFTVYRHHAVFTNSTEPMLCRLGLRWPAGAARRLRRDWRHAGQLAARRRPASAPHHLAAGRSRPVLRRVDCRLTVPSRRFRRSVGPAPDHGDGECAAGARIDPAVRRPRRRPVVHRPDGGRQVSFIRFTFPSDGIV